MNSRRKFLLSGTMASTALLTAKPFTSLANRFSPLTGFSINEHQLTLVHTGVQHNSGNNQAIRQIADLKKQTGNLVLLHAGQTIRENALQLGYDATLQPKYCAAASSTNYKIVYKGDIKIGIITASTLQHSTIKHTNALAGFLKQEKHCNIVICLSQLGFKNKTTVDDLTLAAQSEHLDIIIGGNPENHTANPVVAQNRNKAEVLIHADAGNGFAFGNIEINFDERGNKRSIAINNLQTRTTGNS